MEVYINTRIGREQATMYRILEAQMKEVSKVKLTAIPGCIGITVDKGDYPKVGLPYNVKEKLENIPGIVQIFDPAAARPNPTRQRLIF